MSVTTTERSIPTGGERSVPARSGRHAGSVLVDLALLAVFAGGLVALYRWKSPTFFFIDDAQNEFLPYFADMGRQWLDGHVPVMTTRTLFGGNYGISIERAVFAPQTVLFSVIAASVPRYVLVATAFAATNVFLTAVGAWMVGRVLQLGRLYSLLLAVTVASIPVFLFVYTATWWNGAIGTTWLTAAVAALLHARRRRSVGASVVLGVATLFVLVSGWPHALIGLLVIGGCLLVATAEVPGGWQRLHRDGSWRPILGSWSWVLVPMALAAVVAVPVYSEYVVQGDLLFRFNEISNEGNFCVPTLDQTLGVMNPVASSYWGCYGGYRNWPFPVGFVSVLTTVALVFWRPRSGDRIAIGLIAAALVLATLTQLPSNFSSTRYPFRFLPMLGLVVAILVFHLLRHGVRRVTRARLITAALITVVSAFIGVSRTRVPGTVDVLEALLFTALTAGGIAVVWNRWQRVRGPVFAGLTVAGILTVALQSQGLARDFLYAEPLLREVNLTAEQRAQVEAGYVAIAQMPNALAPVGSARSLLLDWRSFNGYDPVGQRNFMERFGYYSTQGFYDADLLKALGEPADVDNDGVCDFELYGIRSVIAPAALDDQAQAALERCGFSLETTRDDSAFWVASTGPVGATLGYADPGVEYQDELAHGERRESVTITENPEGGTLVFARLWWPGYTATLDGESVPTSSYEGVLTTVELSPGATGTLQLTYTPTSWRWSLPLSAAGLLSGAALGTVVTVRRRRTRHTPAHTRRAIG